METHTTENTENAPVVPVVSMETTETLEEPTLPVVNNPQTTETLEQLPPSVTNIQSETSLPEGTNTQETEILETTAFSEIANTHETAPFVEPTPPPTVNTQTTETLDQITVPPWEITEITVTMDPSVIPSEVADSSHEKLIAFPENHQGVEMRLETAEEEEQVRSVLKVIAASGKFWYDWEKLRNMLSLHIKQVISEYPQAKMTHEEQKLSLGETHAELVKRLDNALLSFVDGPPFTLQRLSEIILDAQRLYPNLSKLALALEKNLSVTSTLTMSTDPYPSSVVTSPNGLNKVNNEPVLSTNPQMQSVTVMENGTTPAAADNDEIMTEVDADASEVMKMDVETFENPMTTDIVGSSSVLVQPTGMSKL